ncbi:cupin domain-containing protein [Mesorhizobium sp. M2A.F.Ca.ET.039.01.1.1]|uniref:cupin domain-containing protein n=1 Tax=Mesorhizobium sp. M2A.F.Ca.ET.039.01.1.1 TaxID=2496746 RepID=UPI001AEC86B7|nr:cupin domain-containing protein [Mesorhizobium sp. M2A.F.Ca.ET.039.01.1.1]
MDPFLDLIGLLRPRATLWGGLEASGRWALSFRKRDDLLFCWVEQGECQLVRSAHSPVLLQREDFVLIRTSAPFTLTSDPSIEPVDSEAAVAATKNPRLRLGEGTDSPVTLHAGRFGFDTANENLLAGLMPSFVHILADDTSSGRVRSLLSMNETESRYPGPGSEFIIARLVELILVEILRTKVPQVDEEHAGLLAGLADPVTSRALSAMHKDVAHNWTVADLARLCGVSRHHLLPDSARSWEQVLSNTCCSGGWPWPRMSCAAERGALGRSPWRSAFNRRAHSARRSHALWDVHRNTSAASLQGSFDLVDTR